MFGATGHGLALLGSEVEAFLQRILAVPCTGQAHGISYLVRRVGKTPAQNVRTDLRGKMALCRIDRRRKGIGTWRFEAVVVHKKPFRRQVTEAEIRVIEAAALTGSEPDAVIHNRFSDSSSGCRTLASSRAF
jgi:hypothetical protein